jgi:hypothetical protein
VSSGLLILSPAQPTTRVGGCSAINIDKFFKVLNRHRIPVRPQEILPHAGTLARLFLHFCLPLSLIDMKFKAAWKFVRNGSKFLPACS